VAGEDDVAGLWVVQAVGEAIEEDAVARAKSGVHAGATDDDAPGGEEGEEGVEAGDSAGDAQKALNSQL